MNQLASTKAGRKWLAVLKRIADGPERIAEQMEGQPRSDKTSPG